MDEQQTTGEEAQDERRELSMVGNNINQKLTTGNKLTLRPFALLH